MRGARAEARRCVTKCARRARQSRLCAMREWFSRSPKIRVDEDRCAPCSLRIGDTMTCRFAKPYRRREAQARILPCPAANVRAWLTVGVSPTFPGYGGRWRSRVVCRVARASRGLWRDAMQEWLWRQTERLHVDARRAQRFEPVRGAHEQQSGFALGQRRRDPLGNEAIAGGQQFGRFAG